MGVSAFNKNLLYGKFQLYAFALIPLEAESEVSESVDRER
jgi:hypothetical protein